MIDKHNIKADQTVVVRIDKKKQRIGIGLYLLLLALMPVFTWLAMIYGFVDPNELTPRQVIELGEKKQALEQQLSDEKQTNVNLRLSAEVYKHSIEQLRQLMVDSQEEVEELEKNIRFYQSLMTPTEKHTGVYLREVTFQNAHVKNQYFYQIVIAQRALNHRNVKGTIKLKFLSAEGKAATNLSEKHKESATVAFNLKFFQQLEGVIDMPEGFSPQKIVVDVAFGRGNKNKLSTEYEWSTVTK